MGQRERTQSELSKVRERLNAYYAAESAILGGAQSYQIGSRSLTRANLNQVRDEIRQLESRRDELESALASGGNPNKRRAVRVLFRDL